MKFKFLLRHFDWILNINFAACGWKAIRLSFVSGSICKIEPDTQVIYNSLVLPHFNYCSTIWNDNNKSHIDKLWKLQKRAARVITKWRPIKNLMDERDLTMMFKVLKNIAPNYLTIMFRKCDNSNYSLRSNNSKIEPS